MQDLDDINFSSIFSQSCFHDSKFWQNPDKEEQPDAAQQLFQTKLYIKYNNHWEQHIIELYPDRIYKYEPDGQKPYQNLSYCFLKKISNIDYQDKAVKFGFKVYTEKDSCIFAMDSSDQFKKWFFALRRYCLLDNFQKKYKILKKINKMQDSYLLNAAQYFQCLKYSDGANYIVKMVEKQLVTTQAKEKLFKEVLMLRRLNNPMIQKLTESYEDDQHVYLVFENFLGTDLSIVLEQVEQINEKGVGDIMSKLLTGISHMHSKGVIHRDIKLENLCVPHSTKLPNFIITNLSSSESFDFINLNRNLFRKQGTPGYMAPEMFKTKKYDFKVDVYSAGIIFYILVYGIMPFDSEKVEDISDLNEKAVIDFSQQKLLCQKISNSGIDLMKWMLQKDPIKRISSYQALNHAWFIKLQNKDNRNNVPVQHGRLRGQSVLSTIGEKTEICETTVITNNKTKISNQFSSSRISNNLLKRKKSADSLVFESTREFGPETLSDKMNQLKGFSINMTPSLVKKHGAQYHPIN